MVEQRPYQQALAHAHARWVHAEDTAELHGQLLTQLAAAIAAATERGEHDDATRYQQHHTLASQQTDRVDTAVRTTRSRLETARAELIEAAGGLTGIITEHHLHARRAEAVRTDTNTLNAIRRHVRDLNNQLGRAEAAAARSLAQSPAHTYDLSADLDQLQAEVDFLHAASAASPAALYTPPPGALEGLDDTQRRAVTALTTSIHSVQLLHLHPGADKTATLGALADTAHHHGKHAIALTNPDNPAPPLRRHHHQHRQLPRRPHRQPHATAGQPRHRRGHPDTYPCPADLARRQRHRHQHQTRTNRHQRQTAGAHLARRPDQLPSPHPTPGHPRP
ncbi:hypothetical protein MMRN_p0550 (plasmid) [Mycobacterium marinum]|nr:hypothetical protein MMRN_p0550 [Mycobacterium marinum]